MEKMRSLRNVCFMKIMVMARKILVLAGQTLVPPKGSWPCHRQAVGY